jgi:exopolysaccharide biosynthesis operon protein EpsL
VELLVKRLLAGLMALLALPALAKEGDTFRPFVSYSRYYDSNLFRLSEREIDAASQAFAETTDQYGVLSAGLDIDWKPGRQRVLARASLSQTRYSRYSSQDNDGYDYQLKWNWQLGNHWSGLVGATESQSQSSYSDVSVSFVPNEVTRDRQFASANWLFHPRWEIGLNVHQSDVANSAPAQLISDYEDQGMSATLTYLTPKGSRFSGQLRKVDADYPNRVLGVIDNSYSQTEYNLLGDWRSTGKLTARGRLGYVQRDYPNVPARSYDGLNGRVSADYFPTGKTVLNLAVYRELGNSDDANATYSVNTGTSLGAAWQATDKITLRANASFENRDYQGDPGAVVVGTTRNEDSLSGSLSASYAPVRMATIDLGWQAGSRDSNISVDDYSFHLFFVNVRADF